MENKEIDIFASDLLAAYNEAKYPEETLWLDTILDMAKNLIKKYQPKKEVEVKNIIDHPSGKWTYQLGCGHIVKKVTNYCPECGAKINFHAGLPMNWRCD